MDKAIGRKSNITLIGMPGAGKSTIGIILAKNLGKGFIDTDILIQINHQQTLQHIMDAKGYLALRSIEEEEILKINLENHIVATGGSAVYSAKAMAHLSGISNIVFLRVDFDTIQKRIHNFESRGIAKADGQTFRELFEERQVLYRKYAHFSIDCERLDQDKLAWEIADIIYAVK